MSPLTTRMLAGVHAFALKVVLALPLGCTGLKKVDGYSLELSYSLKFLFVVGLACTPLLFTQQVPIHAITFVVHPVKRIELDVTWSSCVHRAERQRSFCNGLQPFNKLAICSDERRRETHARRLIFRAELSCQNGWSIKDRNAFRIVRH